MITFRLGEAGVDGCVAAACDAGAAACALTQTPLAATRKQLLTASLPSWRPTSQNSKDWGDSRLETWSGLFSPIEAGIGKTETDLPILIGCPDTNPSNWIRGLPRWRSRDGATQLVWSGRRERLGRPARTVGLFHGVNGTDFLLKLP
jgi:hypothetical protein